MMQAANNLTALSGNSQFVKNGWSEYWANVSAIIAFDVGLIMINATQRNRNAGKRPNACNMELLKEKLKTLLTS